MAPLRAMVRWGAIALLAVLLLTYRSRPEITVFHIHSPRPHSLGAEISQFITTAAENP